MTPKDRANQATIAEAAEIVGVHPAALKSAIVRGLIGSTRGRRKVAIVRDVILVDLEDVETWKATKGPPGRPRRKA